MPTFEWQLIAALLAVAAAAGFLIRRGLKLLRSGKKSDLACNSCGSCSAASNGPAAAQSAGFVSIDVLVREDEK